jgi:tRNA pseudouridine55 synthase
MQVPPKYRAKNVNGKRGYDLARAGVEFKLAPKKVHIYDLQLLEQSKENAFRVNIRCGGGTYIRSIGRDIAERLGTNAVMSYLRRTKSGVFTLDNSIPFSALENDPSPDELERWILPTESVLPFDVLTLTSPRWQRIFNGVEVNADAMDGEYKFYNEDGTFYGIAEVKNGKAKLKTKLC